MIDINYHPTAGLGNKMFQFFYALARCVDEGLSIIGQHEYASSFTCEAMDKLYGLPLDAEEPLKLGIGSGIDNGFHQTPEVVKLIKKYKKEMIKDFGNLDGTFVHVRLRDVDKNMPDALPSIEYYRKCLNQLPVYNFNNPVSDNYIAPAYISSDSPDHELVQTLMDEFDLELFEGTPEETIAFGSRFGNKVLSLGTFSWWIGFIGNQNNVLHPDPEEYKVWHGDIFNLERWNKIKMKEHQLKKIISFSLYNNVPAFQVGAIINVIEAKRLYPDWKCRFYTTDDELLCKQLEYLGAEVIRMDGEEYPALWRFLAVDDADICISRDTDSVVSERELGAVNEWLQTGPNWHRMHDHKLHKYPMMAGMWGYKREDSSSLVFEDKSMRQLIKEWFERPRSHGRFTDQEFLKQVIYPKAKDNMMSHGNMGKAFPAHIPCRYGGFVGSYSFHVNGWGEAVSGDQSVMELFLNHNRKDFLLPKGKFDRTLDRVILATNTHENYLPFWEYTAKSWHKIGVRPTLFLVENSGEEVDIDESLGDVYRITLPDNSMHSAFVAQCVRLLAPCLFPDENITLADIDIIPLSKSYFSNGLSQGGADSFIEYRSGVVGNNQIAVCWNAAKGSTWSEIFNIQADTDNYQEVFLERLRQWNPKGYRPACDGVVDAWFTDQKLLHTYVNDWSKNNNNRHVKLIDSQTGFCRLDHRVKKPKGMHDHYTDFCPRRPLQHNLGYLGRADLDNIDTIKHVLEWYKII